MAQKKDDAHLKAYMGEDAIFNGSLTFEGTVRIDGRFEGQVVTEDTLIVGEAGKIIADINAGTVVCKGRVEGNIVASKKVELHSTSQVVGTVKTPSLYVEVGGVLDGQCDMSGHENKIIEFRKNEETGTGGPG
ncbi:MAG: cell division protein [Nitrospinaceae bacterium]|nr:MAG: cell division protein [Nitrospinaceae bacterium]